MILPPAEYDRYYEGDLTIKTVATLEELRAACRGMKPWTLACAYFRADSCRITLVDDAVKQEGVDDRAVAARRDRPLQRLAERSSWSAPT
jgi:hypothetical protein